MKELMKKSHERENQEMNDKIAVCLGKGGQRDMRKLFAGRPEHSSRISREIF